MSTTIKTTVNGKSAELVRGGDDWLITVAGENGYWDGCVCGCESLSDGERAMLTEKFEGALNQIAATRPSARPAVLEVR